MKASTNKISQVLAVLIPLLVVVGLGFKWPAWAFGAIVVASGCCLSALAFLKTGFKVTTGGLWIAGLACGLASAFLLRR
jgi:hypothetical protein